MKQSSIQLRRNSIQNLFSGYYFDQSMAVTKMNKEERKDDTCSSPEKGRPGKSPFKLWPSFGGSTISTNTSSLLSTPK